MAAGAPRELPGGISRTEAESASLSPGHGPGLGLYEREILLSPTDPPMPASPQKTALVTGAARGIGLATAKRFLAEGWRVALLDIEGKLLRGAVAALADPDTTLALHCDVCDAKGVAAAMETVSRRFGRLDALVNNA